ncbi:MAG: sarcosine oxidase subunit delta [Alphaproteobacteria bacterium]
MLLIPCPHCGHRPETEFAYGGEAHIVRPNPDGAGDDVWAGRLFLRQNTKGWARERWRHSTGCGQWFNLCRNTATNEVGPAYLMGADMPALPSDGESV